MLVRDPPPSMIPPLNDPREHGVSSNARFLRRPGDNAGALSQARRRSRLTNVCTTRASPLFRDARLVRAFVKKLRRKLGDDADSPAYIFTEPRVGYRMAKPSEP